MGPLEIQTKALMDKFAFNEGTSEKVLGETAIAMARVTDMAVKAGRAQQAATSALQLRQSVADIRTIMKEQDAETDDFTQFLLEMKGGK